MTAFGMPSEGLLEHEPFVRRLAGAIVRDPAGADDIAQETWLRALAQHPGTLRSPRGWLARVARTCAWKQHRSESRRRRREEAAARSERLPAAVDEAAQAEMRRRLAHALARLPELQRVAVLLRYQDDMPVREIARTTGVPVDTVKSRLRLALGKLRLELGGADGAALHRARGLAVLLPTAFSSEPCSRLGTAGWGTLTMAGTKKLGLGIAVLLLTLAGGWVVLHTASLEDTPEIASTPKAEEELARAPTLRGTPGEARKVSGTTEGRPAPSSGGGASGVAGSPSEAGSRPGGADGDAPTTAPDVVAGAAFGADGEPLLGKAVLWRGGRFTTAGQIPVGKEAQSTLDMGRDGRFRFEEVENGSWYLGLDLGDGVSRLLYVAQSTGGDRRPEVTLRLGQGGIRGTVWGPDGLPVEGAIVRTGSQNPTLISQTTTDRDGRYAIGQLHGGIAYVSFALAGDLDDDATTFYRHLRIEDDGWTIVDHGSPRGLARVVGRVVCPDGEVVRAKGQIIFERMDRQGFLIMPYDAEGHFDQEVPEDTYRVHIWAPNGSATTSYRPEAPFTATAPSTETDFVLVGARVKGRVPADVAAGRTGIVHLVPTGEAASAAQRAGSLGGGARMVAWSEDGSFVLYGIPPGTYKLTAAATSGEERPALASVNIDVPEGAAEIRQDIARP
ncbi:MAG: sigma-70 family RNA polymerase sigma factor [Planctomycetota bacterium]